MSSPIHRPANADENAGETNRPLNDAEPEPRQMESVPQSTVGTGSMLGIGCLIAVVLLVVIALAFRWIGGTW